MIVRSGRGHGGAIRGRVIETDVSFALRGLLQFDVPVCVVEELLPGAILVM